MRNKSILIIYSLLLSFATMGQQTLSNQPLLGTDSYTRDPNKIILKPGFSYKADASITTPVQGASAYLLNLNISPYPSFVPNSYSATSPQNCGITYFDKDALVGEVSGNFAVSETGAALYEVPIHVSPGTNGISPELSIIYNSDLKDGLLGIGWRLNGLSSISRVAKDVYHNGINESVQLSNSDVFALNGNVLLQKGASYGQSGSQYYTENELFADITSHNQQGNGPQYFIVKDSKGNIFEYGATNDSRLLGSGDNTIMTWFINKVTDINGNYIKYNYKQLQGETVIDNIQYTFNDAAGLTGYNSVLFEYMEKADKNTIYIAGKEFKSTLLLKSITSVAEGNLARKLVFNYTYDRVTLLNKITEVASDGIELRPTTFCWSDPFNLGQISADPELNLFQSTNDLQGLRKIVSADFDGNGFADVLCVYNAQSKYTLKLNQFDFSNSTTPQINFNSVSVNDNRLGQSNNSLAFNVIDSDFDGKQEVYTFLDNSTGNLNQYHLQKISSSPNFQITQLGTFSMASNINTALKPSRFFYDKNDYTGDGEYDELIVDQEKAVLNDGILSISTTLNYNGNNKIIRSLDFDGNGDLELIVLEDLTNSLDIKIYNYVHTANPRLQQIYNTNISYSGNTTSNLLHLIGFGDYNGDGKIDICYLNNTLSEMYTRLSTGVSFAVPVKVQTFNPLPALTQANDFYNISNIDINSDGKHDIVITSNEDQTLGTINNYFSYFSQGDIIIPGPSSKGYWGYFEQWKLHYPPLYSSFNGGSYPIHYMTYYPRWNKVQTPILLHNFDLNGDGIYDPITLKATPQNVINQNIVQSNISSIKGDYIKRIVTGLGKNIDISYANLNTGFDKDEVFVYQQQSASPTAPLFTVKPAKVAVNYVTFNSVFFASSGNNPQNPQAIATINDPQISNTYRYLYYDAVYHKQGKGFLGFSKMISFHTGTKLGEQKIQTFNNTFFIPSLVETKTGLFQSNTIGSIKDYVLVAGKTTSKSIVNYFITQTFHPKSFFIAPQTIENKNYLTSTGNFITNSYNINEAGNIISSIIEHKWKTTDPFTKKESNLYTYGLEGPASNKVYKIKTAKYIAEQNGAVGNYEREVNYTYDPASGNLVEIYNDPNVTSANKVKVELLQSDYTVFGLPTKVSLSGDAPVGRFVQLQYDSKGRFVTKITNALNQVTESEYEPIHGNVVKSKDITGLVTVNKYDGLGRIIQQLNPNGAINNFAYKYQIPAYGNFNRNGVYAVVANIEGVAPEISYFDSYARNLRSETKGFGNNDVYTEKHYDQYGRLWQISEPYFSNQTDYLVNKFTYGDDFSRMTFSQLFKRNNNPTSPSDNALNIQTTYQYNFNNQQMSSDNTFLTYTTSVLSSTGEGVRTVYNVAGQTSTVVTTNFGIPEQNSVYTYTNNGGVKELKLSYGANNFNPDVIHGFDYDELGRQIKLNDPSAGIINYVYNALGELTQQSDANGTYTFLYDALGRLISKTGNTEGATNYQYVSAGNGLGLLEKITGVNNNVVTEFQYDNLNRLLEHKESLPANKIFKTNYKYDKYGRVIETSYPSGFVTKNKYSPEGYLNQINDNTNNLIWKLDNANALDQIIQYTYGNNSQTARQYNNVHLLTQEANSNLTAIYTLDAPSNDFNLLNREFIKGAGSLKEKFTYDLYSRLTSFVPLDNLNQPITSYSVETKFHLNGNIDEKDDVGQYAYGINGKPFLLTGINNAVTSNISLNTLNITYTDFRKVKQINEAVTNKQMDFTYGNDEQRIKVDYKINGVNQYTRYYAQNYEREETTSGYKEWTYIAAPSGLAAVLYNNNGTQNLYYVNSDHLGSPVQLTDNAQNVVEEYSFDAWGRRRNPADWTDYNVNTSGLILKRGFTFHEHIDEFNLINMNGRVYDPVLGRFIQPDNIVQNPDNISTFNRYSYVMNNPLKYIDPTGWGGQGPGSGGTGGVYGPLPDYGPSGTPPPYPYGTTLTEINNGYTFHGYFFTEGLMSNGGWTAFVSSNSPGYYMGGNNANPNNSANANSPNAFYSLPTSGSYGVESGVTNTGRGIVSRNGGNGGNSSNSSGPTSDQVTQAVNIIIGTAGVLASTSQVLAYNTISEAARETGNIATAIYDKFTVDKTLGKFSQRLGIAGVIVNGTNLVYKGMTGKEIKTRDVVDFGIGVALSVVAVSNPIGIIGLGIYGILDAYGAFDGIKEEYLGQTLIPVKK